MYIYLNGSAYCNPPASRSDKVGGGVLVCNYKEKYLTMLNVHIVSFFDLPLFVKILQFCYAFGTLHININTLRKF